MKKFTRILSLALFSMMLSTIAIGQAVINEKASEPAEKLRVEQETELRMQEQQQRQSAKADTEEAALKQEALVQQAATKSTVSDEDQNIFVEQHSTDNLKSEIQLSPRHYNLLNEHGFIKDGVLTFDSVEELIEILGENVVKEFLHE